MSKVIYHNTSQPLTITLQLGDCSVKKMFSPEELRLRTGGTDRLSYDIGWLYESLMQEYAKPPTTPEPVQEAPDYDSTKKMRVKLRRGPGFKVKPEAEQIDGKDFVFRYGWLMEDGLYKGETAWLPYGITYPAKAPSWLASGDLVNTKD